MFADSELDWTLVRPPRLLDGPATGKIVHDARRSRRVPGGCGRAGPLREASALRLRRLTAAAPATTATTGLRGRSRSTHRAQRRQQSGSVIVTLRATGGISRFGHGPVLRKRLAAGATPELVDWHGPTVDRTECRRPWHVAGSSPC